MQTKMLDLIAVRRRLHQEPELSMQEVHTAAYIAQALRAIGVDEVREGVGDTGVVGVIRAEGPRSVLLRASMDALPVTEISDAPYRSRQEGISHACGHDAHAAMLLGSAEHLMARKAQLTGTIVLAFQPGELGFAGSKRMIADGLLENPAVDGAFALHVYSGMDVGTIGVRPGPFFACSDEFELDVIGSGGHGAFPHMSVDPVIVAAHVVTALQSAMTREVSPNQPAVITIGAIHAGTTGNVVPEVAYLKGTVRALDHTVRLAMKEMIARVAEHVCAAMRARAVLRYEFNYPPTLNDPQLVKLVRQSARALAGVSEVVDAEPMTWADDFAFIAERIPSAMILLGTRGGENSAYPHHSPHFDIDERALPIGAGLLAQLATDFLNASPRQ